MLDRPFKNLWGPIALLVITGFLTWRSSLSNGFVAYDDDVLVVQNEKIRTLVPLTKFLNPATRSSSAQTNRVSWRPFTTLAYALIYQIDGYNPNVFHLVSVLFHIANAVLVLFLIFLLFHSLPCALTTALIFLVHPVQAESVVWIGCLTNPLFLFFYLLSFIGFIRWRARRSLSLYLTSVVCFVLSLLFKEMAVSLPLVIGLYLIFEKLVPDNQPQAPAPSLLPYLIVDILYILTRVAVLGKTAGTGYWAGGFVAELLTMVRGFTTYLRVTVFPYALCLEYVLPIKHHLDLEVFVLAVCVLGVLGTGFYQLKRNPKIGFGIILFFLALAPVSNIIPTWTMINERHLYLSLIGWGLVVSGVIEWALRKVPQRELYSAIILSLLCGIYIVLTDRRNRDWKDTYTLTTANLATCPGSYRLHIMMGRAYWDQQDYDKAIEEYQRSMEKELATTVQSEVNYEDAYLGLGTAYIRKGDYAKAISYLEQAKRWDPDSEQIMNNLAVAYAHAGDLDRAVEELQAVLKINPDSTKAQHNLQVFQDALRTKNKTVGN